MRWILASLGVIFILMPIAYTFLRLADKIGPQDDQEAAVVLGMVLWIIGLVVGGILLNVAYIS